MLQFRLWNSDTPLDLGVITNGATRCITSTVDYTIQAVASTCTDGMYLELTRPSGSLITRTENVAPYFLHGGQAPVINGRTREAGAYKISAIPEGVADSTFTVDFSLAFC